MKEFRLDLPWHLSQNSTKEELQYFLTDLLIAMEHVERKIKEIDEDQHHMSDHFVSHEDLSFTYDNARDQLKDDLEWYVDDKVEDISSDLKEMYEKLLKRVCALEEILAPAREFAKDVEHLSKIIDPLRK